MSLKVIKIVNNDISITSGATDTLTDAQALAQILKNKIKLWLGEWSLDTTEGVDYLNLFDNEPLPARKLKLILYNILSGDERVQIINNIETSFDRDTGELSGSFTCQSIYGTVTVTL